MVVVVVAVACVYSSSLLLAETNWMVGSIVGDQEPEGEDDSVKREGGAGDPLTTTQFVDPKYLC